MVANTGRLTQISANFCMRFAVSGFAFRVSSSQLGTWNSKFETSYCFTATPSLN